VDSAVCQTTRESEAAAAAAVAASTNSALWQGASKPREASGDSPSPCSTPSGVRRSPCCRRRARRPRGSGRWSSTSTKPSSTRCSTRARARNSRLRCNWSKGRWTCLCLKRPGVDAFLKAMAVHYEIVVFTASSRSTPTLSWTSWTPRAGGGHRLFRGLRAATRASGYVKDLARLGRELRDVIIIDNSPHAYLFQPDNALPILSYYDDACDTESPEGHALPGVAGVLHGRHPAAAVLGAGGGGQEPPPRTPLLRAVTGLQ